MKAAVHASVRSSCFAALLAIVACASNRSDPCEPDLAALSTCRSVVLDRDLVSDVGTGAPMNACVNVADRDASCRRLLKIDCLIVLFGAAYALNHAHDPSRLSRSWRYLDAGNALAEKLLEAVPIARTDDDPYPQLRFLWDHANVST